MIDIFNEKSYFAMKTSYVHRVSPDFNNSSASNIQDPGSVGKVCVTQA